MPKKMLEIELAYLGFQNKKGFRDWSKHCVKHHRPHAVFSQSSNYCGRYLCFPFLCDNSWLRHLFRLIPVFDGKEYTTGDEKTKRTDNRTQQVSSIMTYHTSCVSNWLESKMKWKYSSIYRICRSQSNHHGFDYGNAISYQRRHTQAVVSGCLFGSPEQRNSDFMESETTQNRR